MGEDDIRDAGRDAGTTPVPVREAAEVLGISREAVRKRVKRRTLRADKAPDGSLLIYIPASATVEDADQQSASNTLTSELRDRLRYVEGQLEAERQAHAEARRIIAGLVERIPAIEAPRDERESPETFEEEPTRTEPRPATGGTQEGPQRPWWRKLIGR